MQLDEFRAKWMELEHGKSLVYFSGPNAYHSETRAEAYRLYTEGFALLTQRRIPIPAGFDYIITKRKERCIPRIVDISEAA